MLPQQLLCCHSLPRPVASAAFGRFLQRSKTQKCAWLLSPSPGKSDRLSFGASVTKASSATDYLAKRTRTSRPRYQTRRIQGISISPKPVGMIVLIHFLAQSAPTSAIGPLDTTASLQLLRNGWRSIFSFRAVTHGQRPWPAVRISLAFPNLRTLSSPFV